MTPDPALQRAVLRDLVHDPEQLEGVGRAGHQVVVRVEAGVEVEGPELSLAQQDRDDELDVHARRVVPGVDDHLGCRAELEGVRVRGAPVRHIGRVEGGLEQLVLQDHPLVRPETLVHRGERLGQAVLTRGHIVLAGVVGAVGEPELERGGAGGVHHVDALEQVAEGLAAYRRVGVADAAEFVVVVLEHVGVDHPDAQSEIGGVSGQGRVVLDPVPRDVQGDGRAHAGRPVHLRGVRELLPGVSRHARLREHLEPCPGVPERPGRQFDALPRQGRLDRRPLVHASALRAVLGLSPAMNRFIIAR